MTMSVITAFTPIPDRSQATPGLFNVRFQQLTDNINSIWTSTNSIIGTGLLSTNTLNAESGNTTKATAILSLITIAPSSGNTINSLGALSTNTLGAQSGTTILVPIGQSLLARSIDSGGQVFNVRAFGAVGNGVADDTLAIQNAITAANGRIVYVPTGSYLITSIITASQPLLVQGDGLSLSSMLYQSDVTAAPMIQAQNSVAVRDVAMRKTSGSSAKRVIKAINLDTPLTENLFFIVERSHITGFNIPVFVDGRGPSQLSNSIAQAIVRNNIVYVNAVGTPTVDIGSAVFMSGCLEGIIEGNELDNQQTGDHNIYAIRNQNLVIQHNRCANTYAAGGLSGIKAITESTDFGRVDRWILQGNTFRNVALPINVQAAGGMEFASVVVLNNSILTSTSTAASDNAAMAFSSANTAVIRQIVVANNYLDSLTLGGIFFNCGSTSSIMDIYVVNNTVRNFSSLSSGANAAVATSSGGSFANLTIAGLHIDGGGTGRQALDIGPVQQRSAYDVTEVNTTSSGLGQSLFAAGNAIEPGFAIRSERSLGFYRSAASTLALSYGTLTNIPNAGLISTYNLFVGARAGWGVGAPSTLLSIYTDGTTGVRFLKATQNNSIGSLPTAEIVSAGSASLDIGQWNSGDASKWIFRAYRNTGRGESDIVSQTGAPLQVFGINTGPQVSLFQSRLLSMRTLAASALTASAANTNLTADECGFTVGGASGASFYIYSGGTVYVFNSALSARAT